MADTQYGAKVGAFGRWVPVRTSSAALAIFVVVGAVYLINPDPYFSGDLNSNSVFAFNVLRFKSIYLDAFALSDLFKVYQGFSFIKLGPGSVGEGHWTLAYPVGTAIITFPLYVVFYIYFKLAGSPVDITSLAFEPYRLAFSHIAAAIVSAGTVALFFLISRRQFSMRTALITTVCLAFATMQWGLLTQSLLQHGPSSFAVMAAAYLLLRASGTAGWRAALFLFAAGALAGHLFMIRPTNLVFMAALLTFAILQFRARSLSFAAGLIVTFGLALTWNWVFFHSLVGAAVNYGYSYNFSVDTFLSGFVGLAVSPVRGLIPNSPFLLFAGAGMAFATGVMFRAAIRWDFRSIVPDTLLFGLLLGASVVLYLSYCFSPFWEGGVYGSRYLSETMPFIVYFLNFSPTVQCRTHGWKWIVFVAFVAVGIFHQITAIVGGNTAHTRWVAIPYSELDLPEDRRWAYLREAPLRSFETRVWNLRDGLVERIWRGVYSNRFLFNPAIAGSTNYAAQCRATIVSIVDTKGLQIDQFRLASVDMSRPLHERFWDIFNAGRKFVRVRIRNDGNVPLFGFETGLYWGFATMIHRVINQEGKTIYENGTVFVSGIIRPGETGDALGSMELTTQKGRYRVEAQMAVNGGGYCGPARHLGTVEIE